MKKLFISLLFLLSIFTLGCQSAFNTIDKNLEGISASEVTYTRKGDFSNATVKGFNYVNTPEKVTADNIYIDESITGLGSVTISLKGYKRIKQKDELTNNSLIVDKPDVVSPVVTVPTIPSVDPTVK